MVKTSFLLLGFGSIIFLGSCSIFQKTEPLEISIFVDRLDTISLKKEQSELILNQDSMIIYFSKSFVWKYLQKNIDTLSQNIEADLYQNTSKTMIQRYSFLLKELRTRDTIRIVNIPFIDSLSIENMSFQERMQAIESNDDLRFGLYFSDICCELLESGNLSIVIHDNFIDTLYKNRYSISDQFSGSSGFIFTTTKGEEIYRCRPYFRYN